MLKIELKLPKSPGVYCITNTVNGKKYVGKTKNLYSRYFNYTSDIRNDKTRINRKLATDINLFGCEVFVFSVLEYFENDPPFSDELRWITVLKTTEDEFGYNLRTDGQEGMQTHPETSKVISSRLKSEWSSGKRDSHSDKMKSSWKNRDKTEISLLFTKTKTKYNYRVTSSDGECAVLTYRQLKEIGLQNVTSSFYRKKDNIVTHKNCIIERVKIEDQTERGV